MQRLREFLPFGARAEMLKIHERYNALFKLLKVHFNYNCTTFNGFLSLQCLAVWHHFLFNFKTIHYFGKPKRPGVHNSIKREGNENCDDKSLLILFVRHLYRTLRGLKVYNLKSQNQCICFYFIDLIRA